MLAPEVENVPANVAVAGQKRAVAALYPKPIGGIDHHRRMSALFHEMEAEIAGPAPEPEVEVEAEPVPEQTEAAAEADRAQHTGAWRKFHNLPEAARQGPGMQDWWTMPTPGRKLQREQQAAWSKDGDAALEQLEDQLAQVGKILEDCKPKDWWTMPTPARKSKRLSVANRAQRQDDLLAQMELQLGQAQGVLRNANLNDVDFSSDEEEAETKEAEPKEEPMEPAPEETEPKAEPKVAARWSLKSLPFKKTDAMTKLQSFAKKHKKELGAVPTKRSKEAFYLALTAALRSKGLLA